MRQGIVDEKGNSVGLKWLEISDLPDYGHIGFIMPAVD